ncbi:MAG TPA: N-acetylglutaminylglutamine synthetase [Mycobacteriales bacterium]|nr:N-acetylglutaminylglutamine synthetase [Mycobacteriales bacterium]
MSTSWEQAVDELPSEVRQDVTLECGWGRLVFGQTFTSQERLEAVLRAEKLGRRDICIYPRDPHVLVARAPQELFVDPSHTYRLDFTRYSPAPEITRVTTIRPVQDAEDVDGMNEVYASAHMLRAARDVVLANARDDAFTYLVAVDRASGRVVGTVTGIDHVAAFGDPEGGTSLWCLAVDPQYPLPAVGEALVRTLVEQYRDRGRHYLDLSVLHDNDRAIRLYERLGFERVPVLCVKRKNPINEPLFVGPPSADYERLNPYARIIADEARRRGIGVEVLDAEWGELRLSHGGRSIVTRESLSELTTAVAMSRCDDKRITRRLLEAAGLSVPRGRTATGGDEDAAFLEEVGEVVVKPARGEQGLGITVGVTTREQLERAVALARTHCPQVLLEELVEGEDLRVVVIGHEVVAAAVRKPAAVIGDGRSTIGRLITAQSRRREAATDGESRIPLDESTADTVRAQGYELDDALPEGVELRVRRTANLHTGGTIHDVTSQLHPALVTAAVRASRALDIPVTGLDFLVPDVSGPDHVFIEANERPGLANHQPQPTAERFVDLLFPETTALPSAWQPSSAPTS